MMTGFNLGMAIEVVVAVLLVLTIAYCVLLNQRLTRLRADEEILRATIAELITATEIAERAIMGLKATAGDCEKSLGARMKAAEVMVGDLDRQLMAGSELMKRITAIVAAASSAVPAAATAANPLPPAPPRPDTARALQAAAEAAAERLSAYRRGQREEAA